VVSRQIPEDGVMAVETKVQRVYLAGREVWGG